MQAEATDSSLREGIEALGVKDTEAPAAGKEEENNTELQDTEMTAASEEDATSKEEKGDYRLKERCLLQEGESLHAESEKCPIQMH